MLLNGHTFNLVNISCLPSSTEFNAIVTLEQDISPVMPYLNSTVRRGHYSHQHREFDFMYKGHIVSMLPFEMKVTGLVDGEHAREVIEELRLLINETWDRRDHLTPTFEYRRPPSPLEVLRLLPRTNCGECGQRTCLAFATLTTTEPNLLDQCSELKGPSSSANLASLRELLRLEAQ